MTSDSGGEWLKIGTRARIPVEAITIRAETSGGPGGQHANRAKTKIVVSLRVEEATTLDPAARERLTNVLGPVVRSSASRFRSQAQNREAALEQLRLRLASALSEPEVRRPTRATRASRIRRIEEKRARGRQKQSRRSTDDD